MTITERTVGAVTILDVDGRIAVQDGASQFGASVRHALHQGRINLVLDLEGVPYIDSTALGELVRSSTTAMQMGGALKLLHAGERVCRLLTVAKLLSSFEVFDDEAQAVASFGSVGTT
jgi:anti-sigma B factor antagonist